VFQMGKVGSQTLKQTLEARYHYYHLHARADFESKFELYRAGRRAKAADYFDIITATREPLSWKISAFFQNLVNIPPFRPYCFTFESKQAAQKASIDELIARFRAWDDGARQATEWFERNFQPATGIRIYDHGFDPEKGWQIFREGKWRVLVLRHEDIKKNHLDALNEFVVERYGPSSRLDRLWASNLSSKKWYSDLMEEFRQKMQYSDAEIEDAYCTPYAKYFYTDRELASMRSKWRNTSV